MRRRALLGGLLAATVLATTPGAASAIRWGEPDAGEHPYVGLMVAFQEGPDGADPDTEPDLVPVWRCSGTLISPTVFLTAGHCTYEADHVEIWFAEDLRDAAATGYATVGGGDASGTPYTHPEYVDETFYLDDLGVVVLDAPVSMPTYGALPQEGYLDGALAATGRPQLFEVVGYGLQRRLPAAGRNEADRVKLKATVRLINDDRMFGGHAHAGGDYVVFSNNANTGGTCNGDSGGPTFINDTNIIVAVTSFGVNQTCSGTGGGYRIDQPDDLAWIRSFL